MTSHSGLCSMHVNGFDQILIEFVFVLFCILMYMPRHHEICTTVNSQTGILLLQSDWKFKIKVDM